MQNISENFGGNMIEFTLKIYKINGEDYYDLLELYKNLFTRLTYHQWIEKHGISPINDKYILSSTIQSLVDYYGLKEILYRYVSKRMAVYYNPDDLEPYFIPQTGILMYDFNEIMHFLPYATGDIIAMIEWDYPKRLLYRESGSLFVSFPIIQYLDEIYENMFEQNDFLIFNN